MPVGWTYTTLEKLLSAERPLCYGVIQPGDDVSDGNTLIRVCDLVDGSVDTERLRRIAHDVDQQYQRSRVENGDILVSIVGTIGRVSVVPSELSGSNIARALAKLSPNGAVTSAWLAYWLSDAEMQDWLVRESREVARKTLNLGELAQAPVRLAPLAEQRRIVEKIEVLATRSRRAREALDTLPALIDRYRQSVLAAAFRGDLTAEWREKQNGLQPISDAELSGLRRQLWDAVQKGVNTGRKSRYQSAEDIAQEGAELPEGWRWVTVDELCPIVQYGTSAKTTEQDGVVVLRMGNIQSGTIVFDSIKSLPEEHEEFPALLLDKGDLLFNRTNSPELVGKCAVFEGYSTSCSFASYLIRLKVAGLNPRLLAAYINSPFGRMWARGVVSQQVGQANINGSKLKALVAPLPPVEEQEMILRKLKAHDEAIARVIDQHRVGATRLANLNQSILAKAFRGELVPQDPNDEPASVLLERIRAERAAAGPAPRRERRPKAEAGG
ncbi:restriction endonuclease subunit S [Azospirillum picis]|nr:restriction endonuclease subunit S [Azospirillum picis]